MSSTSNISSDCVGVDVDVRKQESDKAQVLHRDKEREVEVSAMPAGSSIPSANASVEDHETSSLNDSAMSLSFLASTASMMYCSERSFLNSTLTYEDFEEGLVSEEDEEEGVKKAEEVVLADPDSSNDDNDEMPLPSPIPTPLLPDPQEAPNRKRKLMQPEVPKGCQDAENDFKEDTCSADEKMELDGHPCNNSVIMKKRSRVQRASTPVIEDYYPLHNNHHRNSSTPFKSKQRLQPVAEFSSLELKDAFEMMGIENSLFNKAFTTPSPSRIIEVRERRQKRGSRHSNNNGVGNERRISSAATILSSNA